MNLGPVNHTENLIVYVKPPYTCNSDVYKSFFLPSLWQIGSVASSNNRASALVEESKKIQCNNLRLYPFSFFGCYSYML